MLEPFNWTAVSFVVIPTIGGFTSASIVAYKYKFYKKLYRPWWTPPNWLHGPAWAAAYSSIGYASYLVYRDGGKMQDASKLPLLLYASNLALNWSFPPSFFIAQRLKLSFWELSLATLTATGTGYLFYKINRTAGLIFIPYVLWLGLLTAVSYKILKENVDYEYLFRKRKWF